MSSSSPRSRGRAHPRMGDGVFKRQPKTGGEVGRLANLARRPQGLPRGLRRPGDDIENDLPVRAAEPGQAEPVIDRLPETGPSKIQRRRHTSTTREPVAPMAVPTDRNNWTCAAPRWLPPALVPRPHLSPPCWTLQPWQRRPAPLKASHEVRRPVDHRGGSLPAHSWEDHGLCRQRPGMGAGRPPATTVQKGFTWGTSWPARSSH